MSLSKILRAPIRHYNSSITKTNFKSPPEVMLKPRLIAAELKKKRVEDKSNSKNLILNRADLQVVGSNGYGYSPCLIVKSEGFEYLFNCSEGTQRLFYSNKLKLCNLENIFVTNLTWDRIAGLYGLSLTIQDLGVPRICVTAGNGISKCFDAVKNFIHIYASGLECETKTHLEPHPPDKGLKVDVLALDGSEVSCDTLNDAVNKKMKKDVRLLAYVCELPDLPGALDARKCRDLKVPIGPKLAILKSGQDVILSDGRTIKSSDVCGPKSLGLKFIVIECPTKSDIELLYRNETLESLRKTRRSQNVKEIRLVAHFTGREVFNCDQYQRWIKGFPESCKHIALSESNPNSRPNFVDSYRMQYLLNYLDEELFKPLWNCNTFGGVTNTADKTFNETEDDLVYSVLKGNLESLDPIVKPANLDIFFIRPNTCVEAIDHRPGLGMLLEEAKLQIGFDDALSKLKSIQKDLGVAKHYEPEVIFLGTGSAIPSKLRNTTCILVNFTYPEPSSVILDCGEDSLGQLIRYYGDNEANKILTHLKMIYISHQHADHHIGLVRILAQRAKLTDSPLAILLPPGVDSILNYYNQCFEDLGKYYRIFSTKDLKFNPKLMPNLNTESLVMQNLKLGLHDHVGELLQDIKIVNVDHCINSCAVVMQFRIGHQDMETFTLSYSGDARPSEDFISVGKDCDLLIHEATFDDRSPQDALAKRHCTSSEAIEVGRKMGAKFTVLTHFSQRLAKVPYFNDKFDDKVGFSFDNMSFRYPTDTKRIPILKDVLSAVFKRSLDEIDLKYEKQRQKQDHIDSILESRLPNK